MWDAETSEPVARLAGHEAYVYSLAWRADSQMLVSGSGDHTVRIWETQALKGRMQARRERQEIVAQVEPMVQRLFGELGDAARVVESLDAYVTRYISILMLSAALCEVRLARVVLLSISQARTINVASHNIRMIAQPTTLRTEPTGRTPAWTGCRAIPRSLADATWACAHVGFWIQAG